MDDLILDKPFMLVLLSNLHFHPRKEQTPLTWLAINDVTQISYLEGINLLAWQLRLMVLFQYAVDSILNLFF